MVMIELKELVLVRNDDVGRKEMLLKFKAIDSEQDNSNNGMTRSDDLRDDFRKFRFAREAEAGAKTLGWVRWEHCALRIRGGLWLVERMD